LININFNVRNILNAINFADKNKTIKSSFFGKGNSANKIKKALNSKKFWQIKLQKNFIDFVS
jgi:hypothetical protein